MSIAKSLALLVCVIWSLASVANGQTQTSGAKQSLGSICIAAVTPPNSGEKSLANPSGGNSVSSYSVQIDKRKPLTTARDKSLNVSGLEIRKKHLVRITGDGKLKESFWFTFSEYSTTRLCLFFKSLYETWNLWDAKYAGGICRCNR